MAEYTSPLLGESYEWIALGEKLRSIRLSHKMSPKALAEKIGVPEEVVMHLENGNSSVPIGFLLGFLRACQWDVSPVMFIPPEKKRFPFPLPTPEELDF